MTESGAKRVAHISNNQRQSYAVVGPAGAVEFWFHVDNMEVCGFEVHARTNQSHWLGDHVPPSHDDCRLLGGSCWHDGSSLWASEFWMLGYETVGVGWVYQALEQEYDNRFARKATAT